MNALDPSWIPIQLYIVIDANLDKQKTQGAHTGILMHLIKMPIIWYSKAEQNLDALILCSEYTPLRMGTETIQSFIY